MNIDWLPTRDQPTTNGRLITVVGLVTLDLKQPFPGPDASEKLNARIMEAAGIDRKSWGKISHLFGRMRCPPNDILLIAASVHVNKRSLK